MPTPISETQREQLVKLGKAIKAIRTQKGLTLEQVAQAIDKDRQSIHRLEKGDVNPSYLYLLDVCKGLDVSITDVL